MPTLRRLDPGSLVVIVVTFFLFVIALFANGFSHDLLLEAGVFLVSVKLIIMSYKNGEVADSLKERLDEICTALRK